VYCCNNAGESHAFQALTRDKQPDIHFENTAHQKMQQNRHTESKIATFYRQVHAMHNGAGLSRNKTA